MSSARKSSDKAEKKTDGKSAASDKRSETSKLSRAGTKPLTTKMNALGKSSTTLNSPSNRAGPSKDGSRPKSLSRTLSIRNEARHVSLNSKNNSPSNRAGPSKDGSRPKSLSRTLSIRNEARHVSLNSKNTSRPSTDTRPAVEARPDSCSRKSKAVKEKASRGSTDTPLSVEAKRDSGSRKSKPSKEKAVQIHAMGLYGPFFYAVSRDNGVNFAFSPFSTKVALGIFLAGARGSTHRDICNFMGVSSGNYEAEVHEKLQRKVEQYMDTSKSVDGITIWHRLYTSGSLPCSAGFLEDVKRMYNCGVIRLDFQSNSQKDLLSIIHAGVREGTNGNVTSLLLKEDIGPKIKILMANIVHFNALWATKFSIVEKDKFRTSATETVEVDMMTLHDVFKSFDLPKLVARALEIPYAGGQLSMVVVLPNSPNDFAKMERQLRDPSLDFLHCAESPEARLYCLTLPKFTVSCRVDMKEGLEELGLKKMFKSKHCDLDGLTDCQNDYAVSCMMQKTIVTADKRGKEKAAAISSDKADVAIRFKCDRPFVFFIKDRKSTCIICAGRVVDPRQT
eukprot:GEMP01024607.1.p1 GENE.GEMP01024607.1~~GEMP01024607.1.p1  ORF type:complete len:563 (+),score=87.98 GEMP01024607.1:91-1779(+)